MYARTIRSRWRIAGAIVGSAALVGLALATVQPAGAATGCQVDYQVPSEWNNGFTGQITITNLGDPMDGWTLEFDFTGGQQISQGWVGRFAQDGSHVTVTNESWNAQLSTNATASPGFNATYSGNNPAPTQFTLNGTVCTGDVGPTPTATATATSSPTPTSTPTPGPDRVDNPYQGADVYVNPEWSARAAGEPGGGAIANEPTAVWMDRIAAIEGSGQGGGRVMGLRDHLNAAVEQAGGQEFVFQVVIYNLPARDCAALASNGELDPDEIDRYRNEYIDPIADILSDPAYSGLRIVAIIEIDSLPNLITNVGSRETATPECDTMLANGNYVNGVSYALSELGAIGNVYNYIDIGHHGWLGWDDNFEPFANLAYQTATTGDASPSDVHGFAANVANYGATVEPYFDINDSASDGPVRANSAWIDWNRYIDELSYAQAYRNMLVSKGFDSGLGMLIDTSRNGWGGSNRPTGPGSTSGTSDQYVDASRTDRRIHLGNWCNQAGAGIGERPTAAPASGIDAYVWIKPPGESDGSSEEIPNNEGKGFDRMCDPTYEGNPRNQNNMSGALPDAPLSGHWFPAQFAELLQNAYPPLN